MGVLKKILIFILVLSVGLVFMGCNEKKKSIQQINKAIEELTSSLEFANSDIAERKEMAEDFLKALKNEGNIKNYSYNEDTKTFSFTFNNDVLGGIYLSDFSYNDDLLPMN